ncbi:MAG: diaminopimelate epimerase [Myxococcota bacterium]|nr:diaminopimelate epimerase [Myxococcota bacterium]
MTTETNHRFQPGPADGPHLAFTKMHGAGNDFVVLDGLRDALPKDLSTFSQRIAHRQFGIGCDQVLVVRSSRQADFRMEIFNPDGSQVEMCANGIRAFYKYLRDHGHTDQDEIGVETLSGVVRPRWADVDQVRVDMAQPILVPTEIPTTLGEGQGPVLEVPIEVPADRAGDGPGPVYVSSVSMGNPHAVIEVPDVDAAPVETLGAFIEHHPAFPNRVNVEFISIESRQRIRQRTWERGTGETLACGSGACAVAVTAMLRGVVDRQVTVALRGGELLIEWADDNAHVYMTGPATEVYVGHIPLRDDEPLEA